jgi:hypothetical protein
VTTSVRNNRLRAVAVVGGCVPIIAACATGFGSPTRHAIANLQAASTNLGTTLEIRDAIVALPSGVLSPKGGVAYVAFTATDRLGGTGRVARHPGEDGERARRRPPRGGPRAAERAGQPRADLAGHVDVREQRLGGQPAAPRTGRERGRKSVPAELPAGRAGVERTRSRARVQPTGVRAPRVEPGVRPGQPGRFPERSSQPAERSVVELTR